MLRFLDRMLQVEINIGIVLMIRLGDFLILPFVEFDLEYLLSDQISFKIKAPQIRIIMYQLLSALYYLHSAELVHRDIKPTSILLGNCHHIITSSNSFWTDSDCNVKLGSLNTARSLYSQPFTKVPMSRYSPPENAYLSETTTKPANYWKAADIWSLGMLHFVLNSISYLIL